MTIQYKEILWVDKARQRKASFTRQSTRIIRAVGTFPMTKMQKLAQAAG